MILYFFLFKLCFVVEEEHDLVDELVTTVFLEQPMASIGLAEYSREVLKPIYFQRSLRCQR